MNGKARNALLGAAGAMLSAAVIRRGVSMAFDRNMVGTFGYPVGEATCLPPSNVFCVFR